MHVHVSIQRAQRAAFHIAVPWPPACASLSHVTLTLTLTLTLRAGNWRVVRHRPSDGKIDYEVRRREETEERAKREERRREEAEERARRRGLGARRWWEGWKDGGRAGGREGA